MKIKTILLVCVLVMATNSMVYANEEEGNEKIYYSENIVDSGITEELDNGEIDLYSVTSKIDWTIKPTIMKSGPEFLRKNEQLEFKTIHENEFKKYKVYKFIDVRDIQILITPKNRLDSITEKQKQKRRI